jgi:hypothetical protein
MVWLASTKNVCITLEHVAFHKPSCENNEKVCKNKEFLSSRRTVASDKKVKEARTM